MFVQNRDTLFFYGHSGQLIALRKDIYETPVAWASRLRDSLEEVASLERIASNFASLSTFLVMSGFLYSGDPVVFSSMTKFVYFEVVVQETGNEIFPNFFQQTHIWNTFSLKTDAVR